MPRKSRFTAKISKPGYKTVTVVVTNKLSGAGGAGFVGNALVGGVIGAGVDVASGAMLDLTPNPMHAELEVGFDPVVDPAAASAAAPPSSAAPVAPPSATPAAATTPAQSTPVATGPAPAGPASTAN
jgi:hypothetical protein